MHRLISLVVFVLSFAALAAESKDAGAPAAAAGPMPVQSWAEGFSTPESVAYDAETDTLLVGNINGSPFGKDNNGYIAELSADGKVVSSKLIEGGQKGVTLNAPKGIALGNGLIYVADIDTVRMFDRKTGAPKGDVVIAGATFLNDVALDGTSLYVTDSGFKEEFKPSGTDAIYVIETKAKKPSAKALVKSTDLHGPNGIVVTKDTIYSASFGSNEVLSFDRKGKKKGEPSKLPKGQLDGLIIMGDELIVTSWEGKALYRGKVGGTFTQLGGESAAPADIGFDSKRNRVLVPRFMDNRVEAWDLK